MTMIFALIMLWLIMIQYATEHRINSTSKSLYVAFEYGLSFFSFILFALTEILSFFHSLSTAAITICWVSIALTLFTILLVRLKQTKTSSTILKNYVNSIFYTCQRHYLFISISIITLFSLSGLALNTVPYNWDCLAYHLPRIIFWIQNHSVAHFATNDVRQLASPVFAEFLDLHVYLLTGKNDNLINMVQFASYAIGAFTVLHIMMQINCRKIWCQIAFLLYLATPILYAEAITPQVELVATLWLLIFVDLWVPFASGRQKIDKSIPCITRLLCMGICIGLGYETKPSVCIGQLIFIIILAIVCIYKKEKLRNIIMSVSIALVPFLLIVSPEILRNVITFGSISSSEVGARQLVGRINPRYLFINFYKNLCFNLPTNLIKSSNDIIYHSVIQLSQLLRVDLNDPTISESGMEYVMADPSFYGNDRAINPLQVWTFLFSMISALYYVIRYHIHLFDSVKKLLVWGISISFLIMLVIIRWEPYEVRYESSYIALLCVVIAIIGNSITRNSKSIDGMISGILAFLCIITLINMFSYHKNMYEEKASKQPDGYFVYTPNYQEQLEWMAKIIHSNTWKTIGLYPMNSYPEYAIFKLVGEKDHNFGYVIYEPDHYANISMYKYDDESFRPDCVIWLHSLPKEGYLNFHGIKYDQYYGSDGYYILYPSK